MSDTDGNDGAMDHNFGGSAPFRVGVEEELFLVDPESLGTSIPTDDVLAQGEPYVLGEMCDGVIEFVTPVCDTARHACERLARLRATVATEEVTVMGVGIHPTAAFAKARYRETPHYRHVAQDVRGLLRQSPFCGTHVHVGMPDAETAVVAFNGMRRWVPLLQALGANSPFWHGADSGLASARTVVSHSLPRTGTPRAFAGWGDCSRTMQELVRVGELDGLGSLWWDLRPHPSLGTLEFRALDAQSSLDDLTGLIALVHCLALHESLTGCTEHPSPELLSEASFRAVRDGVDARFSLGGPMRHVADHARDALDLAYGYAYKLDCVDDLRQVERILAEGNGAVRQRRAFAEGGMPAVLELLAAESSAAPQADRGMAAA
jgi:carboxylate-amine ligase